MTSTNPWPWLLTLLSCVPAAHAETALPEARVVLSAQLGSPVVPAGQRHKTWLKVGLKGFHLPDQAERTPANVAIVLDRSGSMAGRKLEGARAAALLAVESLGPQDYVSVVAYDSTVQVLVPARRAGDKTPLREAIRAMRAGGGTALFGGVAKGAVELRRFHSRNYVNRVILLSDGQANVGPSAPGELAQLGASLAKEGISVTTIGLGLGYNEDLMAQLAMASDGNHAFVEDASQLARVLELELKDVLAVVAQDVDLRITFADGARPLRLLGREGVVEDQAVATSLSQLYSGHEKYVMVEVEVPAVAADSDQHVADIEVHYANMVTGHSDRLADHVGVRAAREQAAVYEATREEVVVAASELVANERNKLAVTLRDQGRIEEAREVLEDNAVFLQKQGKKLRSPRLRDLETFNRGNIGGLKNETEWTRNRKAMRKKQHELDVQMRY